MRFGLCLLTCLLSVSAWADQKSVLLLGDDVMFAYQEDFLNLMDGKAECEFVRMPKTGNPDWEAFFSSHVYGKQFDVAHISYGRELMLHNDGKPIAGPAEVWRINKDLFESLRKVEAVVIGCTTTPVRGRMPQYDPAVDWNYTGRFRGSIGPNGFKVNELANYTRTRLHEMVRKDSYLPTKLGAQLMAEQVANSVFEALNESVDPTRPHVLLAGDSIVGGYYSATREQFLGKAIVFSEGTTYNDANPDWKNIVDKYISKGGDHGWDVIQFNWGLHAVKYVDANNKTINADQPGARMQFTPEAYAENLEAFVDELKRTKAKLVFATTTPIPDDCTGSIVPVNLDRYNDIAKEIMQRHQIPVNDQNVFAAARLDELQIPKDVHFTRYGSEELAKQNYKAIVRLLEAP